MGLLKKIKYLYANASDRVQYEIKVLLILLCAALLINLPSFFQNIKVYSEWKQSSANESDWKVTTPEEQGLNRSLLEKTDKFLDKTQVCSFILVRHNAIAYEKYFDGTTVENFNNVYSVTKSVVSALTGIATEKKLIGGTEDKLNLYFPEDCKEADAQYSTITIENLLTMTPGFCEDFSSWTQEKDLVSAVFKLPVKYKPGEEFQYANSATHLLSAILTKAAGMSTYEFAEKYLFQPLGITQKKWAVDGTGIYTGYANLYLRPRDMAKFGQLYLNGGKWEGARIIPEEWVKASTETHYKFKSEAAESASSSTSSDSASESSGELDTGYGYKWWTSKISGYYTYSAIGYGGQYITVIPDLDIVMVLTSRPDTPVGTGVDPRLELLEKYVIPAVEVNFN